MKNKNILLGLLGTFLTLQLTANIATGPKVYADQAGTEVTDVTVPEKHLLLNKDGSYGGSLNATLYGEGAPKNGALDHPDSGYWKINDYYNAFSTVDKNETTGRLLIHNFESYQQTMKNTGGIACCLMVMNAYGFTDRRLYSEERLLKRYEEVNNANVANEGVTAVGLQNMLFSYGIFSDANCYTGSRNTATLNSFIQDALVNDSIVVMPFWADNGYQWKTYIGVDRQFDVVISANPFDAFDHYQDGYDVFSTSTMSSWMLDINRDVYIKSGASKETYSFPCECLVVKAPKGVHLNIEKGEETLTHHEKFPEIHLLKNEFDKYGGGMTDPETGNFAWGGSTVGWDEWDPAKLLNPYFNYNDYYYYKDEGSALFLEHYRAKLQTTASTCGICSTLSALVYYGVPYDENSRDIKDYNTVSEYKLMKQCENINNITIYNRGVANYEIDKLIQKWGFTKDHSAGYNMTNYLKGTASKVYKDYDAFTKKLKTDLGNDHPWLMGWRVGGGHWEVIFGYDDMGTDAPYDDVAVFADSSDGRDGLSDGYNTYTGLWAYNHWYNGSFHWNQQGIVFHKK